MYSDLLLARCVRMV